MDTSNQDASRPVMIPLRDGSRVNIRTPEGANKYLNIDERSHFSGLLKEARKLRNKRQLNAVESFRLDQLHAFFDCLGAYADRDSFCVPKGELQDWLNYFIQEIKSFTKKQTWITSGQLDDKDSELFFLFARILFGGCDGVSAGLAFDRELFPVINSFFRARNENGNGGTAWPNGKECCSIAWIVSGTMESAFRIGWSKEKFFYTLGKSGMLEHILRCSTVLEEQMSFWPGFHKCLSSILQLLEVCAGFVTPVFKSGSPCGDTLKALLNDRDAGRIIIEPEILSRLRGIAAIVEIMDSTQFHKKGSTDATCFYCAMKGSAEAPLSYCSRCGYTFYCSKECQKADWERHKSRCKKTNNLELHKHLSLNRAVSSFMDQNFKAVFEGIDKKCEDTGLKPSDLAVEVDFVPNEEGIIAAMQEPPVFRVVQSQQYIDGQEMPEGLRNDILTDSDRTSLCKNLAERLETQRRCNPSSSVLLLHHGFFLHIDKDIIEKYRDHMFRKEFAADVFF